MCARLVPRGCVHLSAQHRGICAVLQPSFPRSVTLRCSMLSARLGVGHNRCPHCGGVERRSKNNEKPVCPILLYHISIDFLSAESPHFSTVCGFCRKKFEKKIKKGVDIHRLQCYDVDTTKERNATRAIERRKK